MSSLHLVDDFPSESSDPTENISSESDEALIRLDSDFVRFNSSKHSKCLLSQEIISSKCCGQLCVLYHTRKQIIRFREHLMNLAKDGKITVDFCKNYFSCKNKNLNMFYSNSILDRPVCIFMLAQIVGLSLTRFLSSFNEENQSSCSSKLPIRQKTADAISEIVDFIDGIGQPHPAKDAILLPPGTSKKYLMNIPSNGQVVKYNVFKKLFKRKLIYRKSDSFLRCNSCTFLTNIENSSSPRKLEASSLKRSHFQSIREDYMMSRFGDLVSRKQPDVFLTLKLDGMGKHNTKLPHLLRRPKCIGDNDLLFYDVYVCQASRSSSDGAEFSNYVFTSLMISPISGANLVATSLLLTLAEIKPLPRTISLEMDNVPYQKSNKLYGALGWLLLNCPAIDEIYIRYPAVGHTHNHVDGFFGNIVNKLKMSSAASPDEMDDVIHSITSTEKIIPLHYGYEFDELVDLVIPYKYRAQQQSIKIFKENNKVLFSYSRHYREAQYFSSNSATVPDKYPVFKDDKKVKSFLPATLSSQFEESKLQVLFRKCGGLLDQTQKDSYLNRIDQQKNTQKDISEILDDCSIHSSLPSTGLTDCSSDDTIAKFLASHGYKPSVPYKRVCL